MMNLKEALITYCLIIFVYACFTAILWFFVFPISQDILESIGINNAFFQGIIVASILTAPIAILSLMGDEK